MNRYSLIVCVSAFFFFFFCACVRVRCREPAASYADTHMYNICNKGLNISLRGKRWAVIYHLAANFTRRQEIMSEKCRCQEKQWR